ncbi:MAG TPA: response regulator [Dongiaceae bacterium]|nr:response regulator [Dongiaceae bacterium]
MSTANGRRVLVIDDEPAVCDLVRRVAEAEGFQVATSGTHDEFIASYDTFPPDCIFLDLILPDVDGVGLLQSLAERRCAAQIVIMSGTHPELLNTSSRLGRSFDLDIVGTLRKPFRATELRDALRLFQ